MAQSSFNLKNLANASRVNPGAASTFWHLGFESAITVLIGAHSHRLQLAGLGFRRNAVGNLGCLGRNPGEADQQAGQETGQVFHHVQVTEGESWRQGTWGALAR